MKSVMRTGIDKTGATYYRRKHQIVHIELEENKKDPLYRLSFEFTEMTERELRHVSKKLHDIWRTLQVKP